MDAVNATISPKKFSLDNETFPSSSSQKPISSAFLIKTGLFLMVLAILILSFYYFWKRRHHYRLKCPSRPNSPPENKTFVQFNSTNLQNDDSPSIPILKANKEEQEEEEEEEDNNNRS